MKDLIMYIKSGWTNNDIEAKCGILTTQEILKDFIENHGFKFKRIDLPGEPIIEADVDNVSDTSRSTTLSQNGASVSTTEHVLAALVGCEVDNVMIELDGISRIHQLSFL